MAAKNGQGNPSWNSAALSGKICIIPTDKNNPPENELASPNNKSEFLNLFQRTGNAANKKLIIKMPTKDAHLYISNFGFSELTSIFNKIFKINYYRKHYKELKRFKLITIKKLL